MGIGRFLLGILLVAAACDGGADAVGAGGSDGSSSHGSGGAGGATCGCSEDVDCPAPEEACWVAKCADCVCEAVPVAEGQACGDGKSCDGNGACVAELGIPCEQADECASGFCADNVCCDAACEGPCQSCGGESAGTCTPAAVATDPEGGCGEGICDGAGACAVGEELWLVPYVATAKPPEFGRAQANGVAPLGGGGFVVVGEFEGAMSLGEDVVSSQSTDGYIAGHGADGALKWAHRVSSVGGDTVKAVASAPDGGVFVAGYVGVGGVDLGGGLLEGNRGFIARFDAGGEHVWSKTFDVDSADPANLAAAPDGGFVLLGTFSGTLTIGDDALTSGHDTVFVARFDGGGVPIWARKEKRMHLAWTHGIDVDAKGNVAVAVTVSGLLELDDGSRTIEDFGVALLAYDAAGKVRWSQVYDSAGDDEAGGVAFDSHGNTVVAGSYQGGIDFGDGHAHVSKGSWDIFLAKLDGATGEAIHTASYGAPTHQFARGVTVDERDNILLAGTGGGTWDFGGPPLADGGFLVKLASDGTHLWTQPIVATIVAAAARVAVADGTVGVVGNFGGDLEFAGEQYSFPGSAYLAAYAE